MNDSAPTCPPRRLCRRALRRCRANTTRRKRVRTPLLAGRQVVSIQHAHSIARSPGRLPQLQLLDHGRQALPAALHQDTHQLPWRGVHLVVERLHRHLQLVAGLRGGMQRRAQSQGHQRNQLHLGGEEQLAGVLPLTMLLEHCLQPLGAQRALHEQPRHDGQGAVAHEALEDGVEGHDSSSGWSSPKDGLGNHSRCLCLEPPLPLLPPRPPGSLLHHLEGWD